MNETIDKNNECEHFQLGMASSNDSTDLPQEIKIFLALFMTNTPNITAQDVSEFVIKNIKTRTIIQLDHKSSWIGTRGIWRPIGRKKMTKYIVSWVTAKLQYHENVVSHDVTKEVYQQNIKEFLSNVLPKLNIIECYNTPELNEFNFDRIKQFDKIKGWVPCKDTTMFNPLTMECRQITLQDYITFTMEASIVPHFPNIVDNLLEGCFENVDTKNFVLGRLGFALCGLTFKETIVLSGKHSKTIMKLVQAIAGSHYTRQGYSLFEFQFLMNEYINDVALPRILNFDFDENDGVKASKLSLYLDILSDLPTSTFITCDRSFKFDSKTGKVKMIKIGDPVAPINDTIYSVESKNHFFTALMESAHNLYVNNPNHFAQNM